MHHGSTALYHTIPLIMLVMYHRATIYHAITLIILAIQFETQWRLLHNNKYCFTITPTNYYGSGMQLNCKLLSCYCKQVWYFIGGCSPIQCENNNEDMNGGLSTGAIIGTVLAGIVVTGIVVTGIVVAVYFVIKRNNKNKRRRKRRKKRSKKRKTRIKRRRKR